jgi:very-short-patch-repair endonuclease
MTQTPYNKNLKQYSRNLRNESTVGEVMLWQGLKRKQMLGYTFNRQKPLLNYIADFYCKVLNLVIEVDGDSHIGKEDYDNQRTLDLQEQGLTVLRFDDALVKANLNYVLMEIETWIKTHQLKEN